MNLFTSLDDPTREKLTAFIRMQQKRKSRPLRDHMAQWILEAIVAGDCEITGYAVNQHDSKVWTEFTFYKAFEKRDGCEGEWCRNPVPSVPYGAVYRHTDYAEEVYDKYTDTAGNLHWTGTHSGEHIIPAEEGET